MFDYVIPVGKCAILIGLSLDMARLEILKYPDPVLKTVSAEVENFDAALHSLLDDMAETMYAASGVGLAAPQVGVLKRITVVDVSREENELREFINPRIIEKTGQTSSEEGCLSIPDYRDVVNRNAELVVQAQDRHGKSFEVKADGLLAICLQHEIDHLDGVLFIDRLSYLKRSMFKNWFKKHAQAE